MTALRKDWSLRRGDTSMLGLRLWGRDPLTGLTVLLPAPGTVIAWSIDWRGEPDVRTTRSGGGLIVDPDTGFILYPTGQDEIDGLEASGAPATVRVQLIADDGFAITYLDGTVALTGDA